MYRKKLIEVALALEAINKASAKEKSIRFGHPSTLHLWCARRPLAACRAVLFASLVDDPSSNAEKFPTEIEQEKERERRESGHDQPRLEIPVDRYPPRRPPPSDVEDDDPNRGVIILELL